MPLYALDGVSPTVHPTAFVAPTATLVGDVTVEEGASVWYGAVLRADFAPVVVRAGANVQDCSVLHGPPDLPMEVGERATVGHGCVVHGAAIGAETIVGYGSIIMDGSTIGSRSLIAAHSLVAGGAARFPTTSWQPGAPRWLEREIVAGSAPSGNARCATPGIHRTRSPAPRRYRGR